MVRVAFFCGLFVCVCFGIGVAVARPALVVQASADPATTHLNHSFTYRLTAEGSVSGRPELEPLRKRFEILQRSTSQRIKSVNGHVTRVIDWDFELMPRSAGTMTIPPIAVDGVYSNPVTVKVLPATTAGGATADIFMLVDATPKTAYVQSQVVYTLRMFVGISTNRASVTPPATSGGDAIIQKLGKDRSYQTDQGGRQYTVFERRYVVFPQQAGTLTLKPATFEARVMTNLGFARIRRVHSKPVTITVKPAVAPSAGMDNATWLPASDIQLAERWSAAPTAMTVGVPIDRTVVIKAKGLLKSQLPALDVKGVAGLEVYSNQPTLAETPQADGLDATRAVQYVVLAQKAGAMVVPAVRLPWFDIDDGRWKVAQLPAHTLTVAPGNGSQAATPPAAASQPDAVGASPARAAPAATPAVRQKSVTSAQRLNRWLHPWWLAAVLFALAWIVTMYLWWRARRVRGQRHAVGGAAVPTRAVARGSRLRRELLAACRRNDPTAAKGLLAAWATLRFGPSAAHSLGSIARCCPPPLAAAIDALEAHLYARAPVPWSGTDLAAALRKLPAGGARRRLARQHEDLLPLYR